MKLEFILFEQLGSQLFDVENKYRIKSIFEQPLFKIILINKKKIKKPTGT
jgi:hypothetical protein